MTVKERSKRLRDANAEAMEALKGRKGVEKRVTTFKGETTSKDSSGDGGTGAIDFAPMAPTDEQLAQINEYTRSNKTADDLVVFPTLSCNDLLDRDDERFVTDTVKGFASLEAPYGPNGKSYMVGHDYTKLPVGRIFDTSVASVSLDTLATAKGTSAADSTIATASKATFLKNWVYVPKTDSNRQFIENLDYGINWAVSVGVMLEEAKCALPWCGAPMYSSRFFGAWCQSGHDKGLYYTEDAETDSWGYFTPCDPSEAGATKCTTDLYGAKDFYELSQVFLGAQFFAALDGTKGATAKGIMKAASARSIPVIGLSSDEAKLVEEAMPHLPTKVVEAVRTAGARPDEDGAFKWTGSDGLVWTFNPTEDTEVMCLGKAAEDGEEDKDGKSAEEQPVADALGEGSGVEPPSADASADDGQGADPADGGLGTGEEPEVVGQDGDLSPDTTSTNEDGKEATVSKKAVIQSLRGLNVPEAVLRAVEDADGDSLDTALRPLVGKITELTGTVESLTPKAALGDQYVEAKKAEAIAWYVKANQTEPNTPVATATFERLLSASKGDIDLIDALIDQQKSLCQAKFPTSVRRSSFPTDANTSTPGDMPSLPDGDGVDNATGRTVKRIHG